jgi:hypothetical protein
MFKKPLLHGLTAGLLSGLASYVYITLLKDEFMYDFSSIIQPVNVFGASMFISILASMLLAIASKLLPKSGEVIFNVIFGLGVFVSLLGPMLFKLPLDFDEYLTVIFPTYAMVLHFFPPLIWFVLKPFFKD